MIKYYCDFCEKDITDEKIRYEAYWQVTKSDPSRQLICHDCYWKLQGFIKTLKKDWDPRKAGI